MSGVTVVVEEVGNESVAKRVVEASRGLYAKKAETEERPTGEPKQKDATITPRRPTKFKKKRSSSRVDEDLSSIRSI